MTDYFEMGGYAAFIWPSYAVAGVVLAGLWIASRRFVRATEQELATLNPRRTGEKDET